MATEELNVAITAISIVFLAMLGFVIAFTILFVRRTREHQEKLRQIEAAKQLELLSAAIDAQEQERSRIGADLHDDLGPLLSTFRLYLTKVASIVTNPSAKVELDGLKLQIDDVIGRIRTVSHNLTPPVLKAFGLIDALEEMVNKLNDSGEINCTFELLDPDLELELDEKKERALYRIAQELCNNAVKHAEASALTVRLDCDNLLTLSVADNGKGISDASDQSLKSGLGVKNMEARARTINATFELKNGELHGTVGTVSVPI